MCSVFVDRVLILDYWFFTKRWIFPGCSFGLDRGFSRRKLKGSFQWIGFQFGFSGNRIRTIADFFKGFGRIWIIRVRTTIYTDSVFSGIGFVFQRIGWMTLQRCSEKFATHNLFAVRAFAFDFWMIFIDKWLISYLSLITYPFYQPSPKAKTTLEAWL